MKNNWFILLVLIFLGSCKTVPPTGEAVNLKSRSAKRVLSKMNKNKVDADWLNSKAKIRFESAEGTERATAYIRMKKGEKIWVSLRRASFEGVRVLITPDSLKIKNRLGKWYATYPFERIREAYNIPFGFEGMQEMLLGNPVMIKEKVSGRAKIEESSYVLLQEEAPLEAKYRVDGTRFLLAGMHFFDKKENREVDFKLSDHQALDGDVLFSYFRKIQMYSRQTGKLSLELDFSRVVLNEEKSMRFEVPTHYEKVE